MPSILSMPSPHTQKRAPEESETRPRLAQSGEILRKRQRPESGHNLTRRQATRPVPRTHARCATFQVTHQSRNAETPDLLVSVSCGVGTSTASSSCYKPRRKAHATGPPPLTWCQALLVNRPRESRMPQASEPPPTRVLRSTTHRHPFPRTEALLAGAISLRVLGADAHALGSGDFLHRSHVSSQFLANDLDWV